jgi:hypothetical protein
MDDCGLILEKMNTILADESKWTKEAYARKPSGDCVEVFSQDACQWCLSGAMVYVSHYDWGLMTKVGCFLCEMINRRPNHWNGWTLHRLDGKESWDSLIHWNDEKNRTFAEVKELLAEAIKTQNS